MINNCNIKLQDIILSKEFHVRYNYPDNYIYETKVIKFSVKDNRLKWYKAEIDNPATIAITNENGIAIYLR